MAALQAEEDDQSVLVDDDRDVAGVGLDVSSRAVGTICAGITRLRVGYNPQIIGGPAWIPDIQYTLAVRLQLPDLARELRLSFRDRLKLNFDLRHGGLPEHG